MALLASTALPLVVAITEIGLETARMKPENAAALVGAAMLSVLIFPFASFASLRPHRDLEQVEPIERDESTVVYREEGDC